MARREANPMFESTVLEPAAKPWAKVVRIGAPVIVLACVVVALLLHRHDVLDPIFSLFH